MTIFQLVQKNIRYNFSSSLLGLLLTALGTSIFCIILLLSAQFNAQLSANSNPVDVVVGAKGSPLQLILNSIYHVDYPTGNIALKDAELLARNPLVKLAVPLSVGDNYQGFRIVGTDSNFLKLYQADLEKGKLWQKPFEAVVGASVAATKKLKIGDRIIGAHGLSNSEDLHADHPYTITGILKRQGNVVDHLVLTNLQSVWDMHAGHHHEHEEHGQGEHDGHHEEEAHAHEHEEGEEEVDRLIALPNQGPEITSLLIQYRNPSGVAMFPRLVNQTTNMQAASPAIESARLFSIMGIGLDTLQALAYVLLFMAAVSVFISLYNAFKSRKYELAIMRTMGASRFKLFGMMVTEGIYITLLGSALGLLIAHITVYMISRWSSSALIDAWQLNEREGLMLLAGLLIGFIAALIPGIKSYQTPISKTLSTTRG